MTEEYVLEQLTKVNDLEWYECPSGGYYAVRNSITLHINGGPNAFIALMFSKGFKRWIIHEPRGLAWKKPSPKKELLQKILDSAVRQSIKRQNSEDIQNSIRDELFQAAVGWNSG